MDILCDNNKRLILLQPSTYHSKEVLSIKFTEEPVLSSLFAPLERWTRSRSVSLAVVQTKHYNAHWFQSSLYSLVDLWVCAELLPYRLSLASLQPLPHGGGHYRYCATMICNSVSGSSSTPVIVQH